MKTAVDIDDIVKTLEQNQFNIRIKKLIACACYKRWETNLNKLESISFYKLIEDLYRLAPNLEKLSAIFIKIVDRINKKYIYFSIATQILRILKDLYPLSRLNLIHHKIKITDEKLKYIPALFDCKFLVDLKFKISRYTGLSRSKILIFSALNYEFQYSTKDWSLLNHQDFDDLVRNFFYDCETIEELKFRLYGAANYLEDREKNIELANIILESTKSFYTYLQQRHDREAESTIQFRDQDSFSTQFENERTSNATEMLKKTPISYLDPSKKSPFSYPSILITNLLNATSSDRFQEIVNLEKVANNPEIDTKIKESIDFRVERVMSIIEDHIKELEIEIKLDLIRAKDEKYTESKQRAVNIFLQRFKIAYLKYLRSL
ncbi:MAG TPA: hypothetical protein IGS17_02850 [Oscillatoriales cyanobacterium M59_W2019_021]|nr:MAG: hypothetical protein D6728_10615 [Cyanobacteria bacterium J055]HIK33411.1 hypothetical protein [Oscillatoriales cyanobacterium M4454_W2019_049]HIK49852.1 hypothetical protein [Oscillatoriales cyanobacterium M59_W2019_021]